MRPASRAPSGHAPQPTRLLRMPEVKQKTRKSKPAIYAAIRAGTFPAPMPIGTKSVAWLESEVDAWIQARLAERATNRNRLDTIMHF